VQQRRPASKRELSVLSPHIKKVAHSSGEESELENLVLHQSIAVLTLLLPALQKLRRLYLTISRYVDHNVSYNDEYAVNKYMIPLLQRVGGHLESFDTHAGFTELTDIMINGFGAEYVISPDLLFTLACALPAVERISGNWLKNFRKDDVTQLMAKLSSKSSNVIFIELRNSRLNTAYVTQLLTACKRLKTFIYEVHFAYWAGSSNYAHAIRAALKPHEESLEELCLDHNLLDEWKEETYAVALSFRAFKSLKHLKVAALYLFGNPSLVERLPTSLRKLHVTFCERILSALWVADALEGLLNASERCIPNLKKLVLEGPFEQCKKLVLELPGEQSKNYQKVMDGIARVLRVADAKGMETVVLDNPYESGDVERAWGINETVQWEECTKNRMKPKTLLQVQH